MTRIITARHAATDFNRQGRIAGRLDISISDEGIEQAKSVRAFVRRLDFDVVVASPQRRAIQSAELSTGWPLGRIEVRDECAERDYGVMQGLSRTEIKNMADEINYVRIGKFDHSLDPPGGETFEMLRSRADTLKRHLWENYQNKRVLVFSHQTFLQQFHGALSGNDVLDSLAHDIRILEFNFFDFDNNGDLLNHTSERPVSDEHESW